MAVERRLRAWCETDYGKFWLSSARVPGGVIQINAGDAIPDFHMVAICNGFKFVAPQKRMCVGHRIVSIGTDEYRSGGPQQAGQLILSPLIRLDLVTDQALMASARRFNINMPSAHVADPSILFSAPAHTLIAPGG